MGVTCVKCKRLINKGRKDLIKRRLKRDEFIESNRERMGILFREAKPGNWRIICQRSGLKQLADEYKTKMNCSPTYANTDVLWGLFKRLRKNGGLNGK